MHVLDRSGRHIQLEPVEMQITFATEAGIPRLEMRDQRFQLPSETSSLITQASRAFFRFGRNLPDGRQASFQPLVVREIESGLLRAVYREIVIRFREGTQDTTKQNLLSTYRFQERRRNPFVANQIVVFAPEERYLSEEIVNIANDLAMHEEVVFATPNFVSQYRRFSQPVIRPERWHLHNAGLSGQKAREDVNAQKAWEITTGSNEIVIAILDDGVDIEHPSLKNRLFQDNSNPSEVIGGRDFFVPDSDPDHYDPKPKVFTYPYDQTDGNDIHGTACAGVAVANGPSNVYGIASNCRLLPIKIFHGNSLASDERVADAIRYAASHADILSCSWSGPKSPDIELALEDAGRIGRGGKGAAIFCAAGNGSGKPVSFPANDVNTMAVGASTDQGELAYYSDVGPEIDFVAPSSGGSKGIFTTDVRSENRGYNPGDPLRGDSSGLFTNNFGGTSSATPLAAGIGALVLSECPELDREDLRMLLRDTADKLGDPQDYLDGRNDKYGYGRVNGGNAVDEAVRRKQA